MAYFEFQGGDLSGGPYYVSDALGLTFVISNPDGTYYTETGSPGTGDTVLFLQGPATSGTLTCGSISSFNGWFSTQGVCQITGNDTVINTGTADFVNVSDGATLNATGQVISIIADGTNTNATAGAWPAPPSCR